MRKLLLFALLLSSIITSAQTSTSNGNCKAAFTYQVNDKLMSPIAGIAINFSDQSAGNSTYWFWDFGDGMTSTEQNPMHRFAPPITGPNVKFSPYRTVSLTILTSDTCKSMYSQVINIMDGITNPPTTPPASCMAKFRYYQTAFDSLGGTASFKLVNLSEGDSLQYEWDFMDGRTSTEKEPSVTFDLNQNMRKICLTVKGNNNCNSEFCDVIPINNPVKPIDPNPVQCVTSFGYSVNYKIQTIASALVLDFHSKSSPEAVKWTWKFDDGATSSEANPTHIFNYPLGKDSLLYNQNPLKEVCLTVVTATGCSATYCQYINIYKDTLFVDPNPVQCETAFGYKINYNINTNAPALAVDFYSKASPEATKWTWNFSDGTSSSDANPTHTFNLPLANDTIVGPHIPQIGACLTVETVTGCIASHCESFNIPTDTIHVDPIPSKCETAFGYNINYSIKTKAPALVVDFYSKASPEAVKWTWNFGDGTTSSEANPTHVFNLPLANDTIVGPHTPQIGACLTVETVTGCIASRCETINVPMDTIPVDPTPVKCETTFYYKVNYNIKPILPALVLDFYSKAIDASIKWTWDFGDGTTSHEASPTHLFNYPLIKDSILGDPNPFRKVCLTVETVNGCVAKHCETINIYMNTTPPEPVPQCQALIKYYPASNVITIPELIAYKLVDVSGSKVTHRLWTFEDGTTSNEAEPLKTFSIFKPTQQVCLTINTYDSCTSTSCETIHISASVPPDSGYVTPPANVYTMRYESSFPIQMSSCAGWAKAQVYMNDSLVTAYNYRWSTGTEGQEVNHLCPTQMYMVKAIAPDGTYVSGTFLFNSDGTVTNAPFNWWITGLTGDQIIQCNPGNTGFTVDWRLCNGVIVRSDSIPVNSIICDTNESNMIVKDAAGKVVYTENISQNALILAIGSERLNPTVKLFPNPVKDVLNIQYSGRELNEMQLEICDIAGRSISLQKFYNVESGQQISVNVNSLRKGIYLCKLIFDKQVIQIEKFSK